MTWVYTLCAFMLLLSICTNFTAWLYNLFELFGLIVLLILYISRDLISLPYRLLKAEIVIALNKP